MATRPAFPISHVGEKKKKKGKGDPEDGGGGGWSGRNLSLSLSRFFSHIQSLDLNQVGHKKKKKRRALLS